MSPKAGLPARMAWRHSQQVSLRFERDPRRGRSRRSLRPLKSNPTRIARRESARSQSVSTVAARHVSGRNRTVDSQSAAGMDIRRMVDIA